MTTITSTISCYLFLFGFVLVWGFFACFLKQCEGLLLTYYSENYYLLLLPNYLLIITYYSDDFPVCRY